MAASDSAYQQIEAFRCVDFAKNLQIESYSEKYLSRRLCGDRADGRVDIEHTKSQVSCRYDELIAKEAAKTKEQAVTAKELTLELEIAK